jgi:hypothetical protein
MKRMKIRLEVFLFLLIPFFSCNGSFRKADQLPKPIPYKVLSKSAAFNNTAFTIDSSDNSIIIKLQLSSIKDLPIPINKKGDTLFGTSFHFDFYSDNMIIKSEFSKHKRTNYSKVDSTSTADNLCFVSDTIYLNASNELIYELPMHALHSLKKGKQTIELRIWQNTFTMDKRNIKIDSTWKHNELYNSTCLFDAKIKFDINIPTIYRSTVYGFGLQLKNDSTFSPAGMDNTIWKSSYPDIYWTIYYPANTFYAQTTYQSSTDKYTNRDTFNLYHYYPDDSLGIGVFDHDDLSRDDGLGYWNGEMNYLRREPLRRFRFGNIDWFDIKLSKATIINQ